MVPKKNRLLLASRIMSGCSATKDSDVLLEKSKSQLRRIYEAGVQAVLPSTIIEKSIRVIDNELKVCNKTYTLNENIYLVGFGKAVMGMAAVVEEKLQSRLKRGIVSVPRGSKDKFRKSRDKNLGIPNLDGAIEYRESSVDNQPDSDTLRITREIVDFVENLSCDDTLIVLISGGGSALLFMPKPSIRSDDKLELCKKLQNSGADIKQLNIVRQKLSMVKGGGLARIAYPARVITLILSDIVGDPIDLIASGPTVHSDKSFEDVASILKKFDLYDKIKDDVKTSLSSGESIEDDSLLNARREFKHVENFIIGNNTLAIEAASQEALRMGLSPIVLRNDVVGRVEDVSEAYASIASLICRAWNKSIDETTFLQSINDDSVILLPIEKINGIFRALEIVSEEGIVLIGAGEPTVIVKGSGKGGRNQELALRFSLDWLARVRDDSRLSEFEVIFLSAGTDGQDGPTDACGAFGYSAIEPTIHALLKKLDQLGARKKISDDTKNHSASGTGDKSFEKSELGLQDQNNDDLRFQEEARSLRTMLREAQKIVPQTALANNDSYNFYSRFKRGKDLLKTGISGTNVMDLHLILIKKERRSCQIYFDNAEEDPHLVEHHDLRGELGDT